MKNEEKFQEMTEEQKRAQELAGQMMAEASEPEEGYDDRLTAGGMLLSSAENPMSEVIDRALLYLHPILMHEGSETMIMMILRKNRFHIVSDRSIYCNEVAARDIYRSAHGFPPRNQDHYNLVGEGRVFGLARNNCLELLHKLLGKPGIGGVGKLTYMYGNAFTSPKTEKQTDEFGAVVEYWHTLYMMALREKEEISVGKATKRLREEGILPSPHQSPESQESSSAEDSSLQQGQDQPPPDDPAPVKSEAKGEGSDRGHKEQEKSNSKRKEEKDE